MLHSSPGSDVMLNPESESVEEVETLEVLVLVGKGYGSVQESQSEL